MHLLCSSVLKFQFWIPYSTLLDSYNVLIMKSIAQIGDLGLLIWDMLCLAVLTGLMGFFKFNLLHLIVEMIVLVLWLAVHVQFRRKVEKTGLTFLNLFYDTEKIYAPLIFLSLFHSSLSRNAHLLSGKRNTYLPFFLPFLFFLLPSFFLL